MHMGDLGENIYRLLLMVPVFLPAIVVHEFAHAWTADRLGDPTPRSMGRLTLEPGPHIDPIGALFFVLSALAGIGFGWAKPVPVKFSNLRNPIRDMAIVAAAGPISNVGQALVCTAGLGLLHLTVGVPAGNWLDHPVGVVEVLFCVLFWGVFINLVLAAFNLIPVPPLDGGRILVSILPYRQALAVASLERFGFLIVFALLYFGIFDLLIIPVRTIANWLIGIAL